MILSPGDVLLALGIAATLQAGMLAAPVETEHVSLPEGNGERPD